MLLWIRVWLSDMTSDVWRRADLEKHIRECCTNNGCDFPHAAQLLRAALTGSTVSPPIFTVAEILGRDETLDRIDDYLPPNDRERVTQPGKWLYERPQVSRR